MSSIGIIGYGIVGRAAKNFYKDARIYDKFKPVDSWEEVIEQDILFLCLPTPFQNDKIDLSALDETFSALDETFGKLLGEKIIVIKSTVAPGATDRFQIERPDLRIFYIPEFLTENTSFEDFAKPDKNIIGFTPQSQDLIPEIIKILPLAPTLVVRAKEAEMIKCAINAYYALKVIFNNQLFDLCQHSNINYHRVNCGLTMDKRILDSHSEIFHKGYRGFGGKCLPKDLNNLIAFGNEIGLNLPLFRTIREMNERLKVESQENIDG